MKRFTLFSLLFFALAFWGRGQVNLVYNGSFEILNSCPSYHSEIDSAKGWHTLLNGGGGGTPDLYNTCTQSIDTIDIGVPINHYGFQYPRTGNGFAGISILQIPAPYLLREYIQSKLIAKLSYSSTYCVKFYANLPDSANTSIKTLGAYFDNGSIYAQSVYFGLAIATPQVYNSTVQLNDKINWMKIEGSFIATGNEEYITIGDFFTNAASDTLTIGPPYYYTWSYYYIDDISVIDANLNAYAGRDTIIHNPGDSVFIGRPAEIGLNEDCIWFVNGVAMDTIAGGWVKPAQTTTYVLQQTICGNVKYDTITVTVSGEGVEQYAIQNLHLKTYPNPAKDEFTIEFTGNTKEKEMLVELYNVYGILTKQTQSPNQTKITINTKDFPSGIYFYRVRMGDELIGGGKIVINE